MCGMKSSTIPRVVDNLKAKGVRFVEEIDQIPNGAITVFSAHGVSEKVEQDASVRGLRPLDATCPLCLQGAHGGPALRGQRLRHHPGSATRTTPRWKAPSARFQGRFF